MILFNHFLAALIKNCSLILKPKLDDPYFETQHFNYVCTSTSIDVRLKFWPLPLPENSSRLPSKKNLCTTSKVAVIEVKHNDTNDSSSSSIKEQIRANLRKRVKQRIKLNVQVILYSFFQCKQTMSNYANLSLYGRNICFDQKVTKKRF